MLFKTYTLLLLIFFFILNGKSQESFKVKGFVVNQETHSPIAFASITIINKSIGTISNNVGEFAFNYSKKNLNDTLIISSIGFASYKIEINKLTHHTDTFYLKNSLIMLSEFVVTPLTAKQIVKKAIEQIPTNYPQNNYLLKGFYRHFRNENNNCVSLIESALVFKDDGYNTFCRLKGNTNSAQYMKQYHHCPVKGSIYIEAFRKSYNQQNFYKEYFFNENMIIETLRNNRVKYRNFELDTTNNNYYFENQLANNNRTVYVIRTAEKGGAKIYIDTQTYAIVKIENEVPWSGKYLLQHKVKNYDKAVEKIRSMKLVLEFQMYKGKMYLKYLNYDWSYEIYSDKEEKTVVVFDVNNLLVINDIVPQPTHKDLISYKKMNKKKRLEDYNYSYNKTFWSNYNLVKQNPIDKSLLHDLERKKPLEKQFNNTITK